MAQINVWVEGSLNDLPLVSAQSGKRIVVLRIACHTPVAGTLTLNTRVGANRGTAIASPLTIGTGQLNDVQFGRPYALATNVGEALTVDVTVGVSAETVYVTIWYEVVP